MTSSKILGPCWMQCLTWREIVIDDIGDGDEDDECCDDNCDNVRAGKIIVISKL